MFPVPFNDAQRQAALESYDVLDTSPEEVFDCLTRLACRQFGVPISLVSLVDECRQWFKSKQGLDVSETPREMAFCGHAILSDDPFVVLNTTQDERFVSNPLVTDDPHLRFYAGVPLVTQHGFRLGTFCIIDLAPRRDFEDDDIAALKHLADATMQILELRKQARQQNDAIAEARFAEDARTELLSVVAHEIRSPIATLVEYARTLNSGLFGPLGDKRYEELSGLMAEAAQQVMDITDRTLELACSRAGDVEIRDERISVQDLFEEVERFAANLKRESDSPISFAVPAQGIVFSADRTFVMQMLFNLVTNAFKYGDAGASVELRAEVNETGVLELTVTDSGIGMSGEDIERALEPHTRIKHSDREDPGGIGIGLSIVKRLVELHGGRLVIESVVGEGTRASLQFPPYRVRPRGESIDSAA